MLWPLFWLVGSIVSYNAMYLTFKISLHEVIALAAGPTRYSEVWQCPDSSIVSVKNNSPLSAVTLTHTTSSFRLPQPSNGRDLIYLEGFVACIQEWSLYLSKVYYLLHATRRQITWPQHLCLFDKLWVSAIWVSSSLVQCCFSGWPALASLFCETYILLSNLQFFRVQPIKVLQYTILFPSSHFKFSFIVKKDI